MIIYIKLLLKNIYMYKIKQEYPDFIVKENIKLNLDSNGDYGQFLLRKIGLDTKEVINKLRVVLKTSKISYAGLKDKNAETYQYISIYKPDIGKIAKINFDRFELKLVGYGNNPIFLGQLDNNTFIITIRNLDYEHKNINFIENYFDEQRFSKNNVSIGRFILKKEYKSALNILGLDGDLNELKKLSRDKLRFYINAYQSYLWNSVVANLLEKNKNNRLKYSLGELVFLKNKIKNFKVPMLNFDTEFNSKSIEESYNKIMKIEGITKDSFLIREIPELINESVDRDVFIDVKIKSSFMDDELNKGKFKQILEFKLPKGGYATIVIKKMFSF